MTMFNCGVCGHPGMHTYTVARGGRPTAPCRDCATCKREQSAK